MNTNNNPFVYSLKQDTDTTISKEEFEKILLELEIKRIQNERASKTSH